jgi:molecular chaperone DnaJ
MAAHTKNYYDILGISKDASAEDIKKAYRKLSMEFHPDRNPNGEERFKEINEAYATLSDDTKRKAYDNPNPFGGMGTGRPGNTQYYRWDSNNDPFNSFSGGDPFADIFNNFFGQGFKQNMDQKYHQRMQRGTDVRTILQVSCRESYFGMERTISYRRLVKGQMVTETKKIAIPKGADSGMMLRMSGAGNESHTQGGAPGDLILTVELVPDQNFTKEGNHLVYKAEVELIDMLLGSPLTVPHYDGEIAIKIPANIPFGSLVRVAGKGFSGGDLHIQLSVKNTVHLTEGMKEILTKFKTK